MNKQKYIDHLKITQKIYIDQFGMKGVFIIGNFLSNLSQNK